jgi:hypothetical protein
VLRSLDFRFEDFGEPAIIRQPGERIGSRQVTQMVFRCALRRDVPAYSKSTSHSPPKDSPPGIPELDWGLGPVLSLIRIN